jgi:RNA polymerase-binding transcription factor DksA
MADSPTSPKPVLFLWHDQVMSMTGANQERTEFLPVFDSGFLSLGNSSRGLLNFEKTLPVDRSRAGLMDTRFKENAGFDPFSSDILGNGWGIHLALSQVAMSERNETMDANGRMNRHQEQLQERRGQILKSMEHLKEENASITGKRHSDRLDYASDETGVRVLDRLEEEYLVELGRIEKALARMLAGTYGLCRGCRRPIERKRLDAFPEADFCLACQRMREGLERT